jgi:hypothetical protein
MLLGLPRDVPMPTAPSHSSPGTAATLSPLRRSGRLAGADDAGAAGVASRWRTADAGAQQRRLVTALVGAGPVLHDDQ